MRKLSTMICIILFAMSTFSIAQTDDMENIWSLVKTDPLSANNIDLNYRWIPSDPRIQYYEFDGLLVTVEPNFRPWPGTNVTQSEMSVDVHPLNNNIIFCSVNASNWPVSTIYGTGVYWSSDGGTIWTGFNSPPFGTNRGDPVSLIGTNGNMYEGFISSSSGQGIAVSTNGGTNWSTYTVAPNPGTLADKNHLMVDKKVGSPYEHRVYDAWTDFGGTNNYDAVIKYSSNFGQTWSTSFNLSNSLASYLNQGANVQTGSNGEVYATWAIYVDATVTTGEDGIGFTKSTDGGLTWSAPIYAYQATNFGIRTASLTGKGIRANSFPSMAVDISGGPNNGNIYICWSQDDVTPAGSDPDIVLIKSTNGGSTWSSPIRVNNDAMNNGKDQFFPWSTVDQSNGQLLLAFYDSRNVPNSQAEVFIARSSDGGITFDNFVVSDQAFTLDVITGFSGNYAGDYIGIAAYNNVAYPYWMSEQTGNAQGWMAKVTFGPPCPVEEATNPNPVNEALNVPISLSQLSWTNGTGSSQCEVWFGPGSSMSMVYSGSLISSWSIPSQLSYNTVYSWKIVGKNDTCDVSGPVWSFKTELTPGTTFIEPFDNLNYWNAIGPVGTTNWSIQNTANAGGTAAELRLSWTPQFNGLSKLVSDPIPVNNNNNYTLNFSHMLDWYANPAPFFGIGVSYDGGATYTSIWEIQPTANVNADTVSASFLTPPAKSGQSVNLSLVLYCNGNSYNYDYWYIDDFILMDDDFSAAFQLAVSVGDGWNLVSIPGLHPVNQNVNTWWSGRDPLADVFRYNTSYQPVITVTPGTGYWMKHSGANTYETGGEWPTGGIMYVPHIPIAGSSGWNIIGGYDYIAAVSGITTTPPGLQEGLIYGYTPGVGYEPVDNLVPGYGYWIRLTGAGDINLPPSTFKSSSKFTSYVKEEWGKIIISDNNGNHFTLYAVNGKVNLNDFELPPPSPDFDVRFTSGRFAEDITSGSQSIELNHIEYPVKVRVENINITLEDVTGNVIKANLKSGEEISINNSLINKLMVSEETIPFEYSLEQNYPNPFNPETNIKFSIPKQTNLKINLYNALGELIRTIAEGLYEPGYYQVSLNGENLSSGIYIYRLESSEVIQTKKMILLK